MPFRRSRWLCTLIVACPTLASAKGSAAPALPPAVYQRGTPENPVIVKPLPTPPSTEDLQQWEAERKDQAAANAETTQTNRRLIFIGAAQGAALLLQFIAFIYQGKKLNETVRAAADQSKKMQRSVEEAERAANAIERVATATQSNAQLMQSLIQKQMRAYLSVDVGAALYQDANVRFEARPVVTNYGLTPARNVSTKTLVGLLDGSVPDSVAFTDVGKLVANDLGLPPRQPVVMSGVLDRRIPDEEVEEVMRGNTFRLYAWGRVEYEDVYGGSWHTNFRINYTFLKDEKGNARISGFYHHTGNDAT